MRNMLSMLFLAWLTGIMGMGRGNDSSMSILAAVGSARALPAPVTAVAGKQTRMDRVMDSEDREAQSLRGMGVLVGRVTMGPVSPVVRRGDPDAPVGVPDARMVISGLAGQEIKSVVTDADGRYSVHIPPGSYHIDMPPLTGGRFTKDLPATVTITEGQETRLDIRIDTGIR